MFANRYAEQNSFCLAIFPPVSVVCVPDVIGGLAVWYNTIKTTKNLFEVRTRTHTRTSTRQHTLAHTSARTRTHKHARARARTHTHTHTNLCLNQKAKRTGPANNEFMEGASIWGSDQNTHTILVVSLNWFLHTDNSFNHEGIPTNSRLPRLYYNSENIQCVQHKKKSKIAFGAFLHRSCNENYLQRLYSQHL